MKPWVKGGLIGFLTAFVGLWIMLFIIGYDSGGWRCISPSVSVNEKVPCSPIKFIFSPFHIGFVLFFSWVGFFAGIIDAKKIGKIIEREQNKKLIPLKITSTVVLTAVIVFAAIGFLTLDNWVEIMIDAITFGFIVVLISWIVGKVKYKKR